MVAAYALPPDHPILAYTADEWRQMAARKSLSSFTKRMFPPYEPVEHHHLIASFLELIADGQIDRFLAILPPRFGKSTLCSEYFPAWFLGNHPDQRIIGCSHTAHLAFHFSNRVRNILNHPLWPFQGVSVAKDEAAKSVWAVKGHMGGYVAAGVGGSITGFGANILLIDDAVKSSAEADSQTFRDNAWEWYTGTALTRLEPRGAVVVVGTRWHEDDLIGRILASEDRNRWTVLHVPALSEDNAVYASLTLPSDLASQLGFVSGDQVPLSAVRFRFGDG